MGNGWHGGGSTGKGGASGGGLRSLVVVVATTALIGCGSSVRERELERVAKDWCMTIRASQVVPVYPLTEDVRPGDVYLVRTPIAGQVREYRRRGFLPLDHHKARLGGLDYVGFYGGSHGIGERSDTPYHWMFSVELFDPQRGTAGSLLPGAPPANVDVTGRHRAPTAWWHAPRAYFPTYSFEVQSGRALALAIPIQSVPVGLSLMATDSATGSVQLSDAYVYGVSERELDEVLSRWLVENRAMLAESRARNPAGVFVRVVNRVYMIGAVNVSLTNRRVLQSGADVGAPPGLEHFVQSGPATGAAVSNATLLDSLSDAVSASMPGGSMRVQYASSRNVLANESFDRPLTIGYLGLDYPVMPDGTIGAAVSTLETLTGRVTPPAGLGEPTEDQGMIAALMAAIEASPAPDAGFDAAMSKLPQTFQRAYTDARGSGAFADEAFDAAYDAHPTRNSNHSATAFDAQVREALLHGWRIANAP